jgi:hypothetical protein
MASILTFITTLLLLFSPTWAHMSLYYPPQFKTPWNPQAVGIDYEHRDPIAQSQFPCKLAHIGMTEKSSVATWAAGSEQKFQVTGTATRRLHSFLI